MSTRCWIAKQVGPDSYRSIYCMLDGSIENCGAILAEHYATEDRLDSLLDLGYVQTVLPKLNPDPTEPHEIGAWQGDVTKAYGRDLDNPGFDAEIKTLAELHDDEGWVDFAYIFTEDKKWKFINNHLNGDELLDLNEALESVGMKLPDDQGDDAGEDEIYEQTM